MGRFLGAMAVALVALTGTARADAETPLQRARTAISSLEYPAARAALDEALAAGQATPEELVEIYRLRGVIAGVLGDAAAATDAFERMLVLSPTAVLPAGTAPKIAKPFAAAQAKASQPLALKVETAPMPPSVTVAITDPLHMITTVRTVVRVDGKPEQTFDKPTDATITIVLPRGGRLEARVIALDDHSNHLAEVGSELEPVVIISTPPEVVQPKPIVVVREVPARPIYEAWWLYAGTSVAFALVGTGYGLAARSARDDLQALVEMGPLATRADAAPVEERGKHDALVADLTFGAAGAFAIGAGIFYVLSRHDASAREKVTTLAVPMRGGGAVVVGASF